MIRTRVKLKPDPTEYVRKWHNTVLNNSIHHVMFQYGDGAFYWYKYGSGCSCSRCNVDLSRKADEYEHSLRVHAHYRRVAAVSSTSHANHNLLDMTP